MSGRYACDGATDVCCPIYDIRSMLNFVARSLAECPAEDGRRGLTMDSTLARYAVWAS